MLPTDLDDHRRSAESTLLDALRARDPLALAEIYHRTVPAAHACARRLLTSPAQIEALLRTVYLELWEDPPKDVAEGWIRARCFALATEDLRARGAAPASPSAATLLPDLPVPDVRYIDAVERTISELAEHERMALLLAHDCGVETAAQGSDAAEALDRALLALAGPELSSADAAALDSDPCPDGLWMGDWTLGLVEPSIAQEFEALVASRPGCAARARALRRGRRRLEGLPPTPDMGQRILVTVLSATGPQALPVSSSDTEDHALWLPPSVSTRSVDDPGDATTGELELEGLWREDADEVDEPPESQTAVEEDWGRLPGPHDDHRGGSQGGLWNPMEDSGSGTHQDHRQYRQGPLWDIGPPVVPERDDHVTITEPVATVSVSVSMPDSAAEDTVGMGVRRPNPYAELVDLSSCDEEFELPDPHRVGPTAPVTIEPETDGDAQGFDSFYPDDELMTCPSAGQRLLVVLGYVLPILLGASLGLFLADLLFTR